MSKTNDNNIDEQRKKYFKGPYNYPQNTKVRDKFNLINSKVQVKMTWIVKSCLSDVLAVDYLD